MEFWKEHQFIPVDARYGGMPVDAATQLFGGKRKRQPKPKSPKMDWENCRSLGKLLGVLIGYDHIEFPTHNGKFWTTVAFENGKRYGFKHYSPNQCYESLISLQRDRLARLSDAEAIAASEQAKDFFN